MEFFNVSKKNSGFKNSKIRFRIFPLFLDELSVWRDIGCSSYYKIRKIRRVHRKIERGVCLCTFRGSFYFWNATAKRDYVPPLNKINLFFLHEYSPCVQNILRMVLGIRNNPDRGSIHFHVECIFIIFSITGCELCFPRYWWLFIHVITLEKIKKPFNVETKNFFATAKDHIWIIL